MKLEGLFTAGLTSTGWLGFLMNLLICAILTHPSTSPAWRWQVNNSLYFKEVKYKPALLVNN